MLTDSEHAENVMATFSYQEDSVHFPPELTDPALLAEVNYFSVQRFACSFYKMTCLEHQLKAFEKHVSQRNSILYFAFCSGGFLQAFSRPKSERGDKHPIPSLFILKNSTSAGRLWRSANLSSSSQRVQAGQDPGEAWLVPLELKAIQQSTD